MKLWLKVGALIVVIWLIAIVAIRFAQSRQPTAASVTAFAQSTDLNSLQGDSRARAISRMEDMVNRISFDDRQQLDHDGLFRDFFKKLTPDEQGGYLDATLPTGFKQLMESFNKMDPFRRRHMVERAVAQMKDNPGQGPPGGNSVMGQKVIDQGLKSFYSDASADTKLDLAPLIEQMQRNLQDR